MSDDLLVELAIKRQRAFRELQNRLKLIKETIKKIDDLAEVYLFGSVAEERYNYSSDIDVLVITNVSPAVVIAELWKVGIEDPFEIHVQPPDKLDEYMKFSKLIKV